MCKQNKQKGRCATIHTYAYIYIYIFLCLYISDDSKQPSNKPKSFSTPR